MKWILTALASLATVVAMGASNVAHAAIILSSYSAGGEGGSGPNFAISDSKWESFGFRTGLDGTYSLDSVTMRLSGVVAGGVVVSLYDNATRSWPCGWNSVTGPTYCDMRAPGQIIGELGTQMVQARADYQFNAQGNILLEPDTHYWIVFKGLGPEIIQYYEYGYPGDPWYSPFQSETGATIYDFAKSPAYFSGSQLGADWSYHSGLNFLEVRGTLKAVPEPVTLGLGILALGAAGILRRRQLPLATQTSVN